MEYPAEVQNRIQAVEHGLLQAITIHGQPQKGMDMLERMSFYRVPGVSVAVINAGKLEWASGYGVLDASGADPVTPQTLFQAASISKPVTAMAALYLVQTGALALDDDVNTRLRSWHIPENEYTESHKVTLRRLLSHTAGLTVHGFPGYASNDELPTLLQVLDGLPPANTNPIRVFTTPGGEFSYSGGGYIVLQQLIQDVTGQPFPDFMAANLLRPLSMDRSTYAQPLPVELASNAAVGHTLNGQPVGGKWHTYPEMAAAGLWTTPTDLARYIIEIQLSAQGKSNRILTQEMTAEMLTPQMGTQGLGPQSGGNGELRWFSHGGDNFGFKCGFLALLSTGQGVVIMVNSDNLNLISEIMRSVASVYDWPALPEWSMLQTEERSIISFDPGIYQELTGAYQFQDFPDTTIHVTVTDGNLHVSWAEGLSYELYPDSELSYFTAEDGIRFEFHRNDQGKINEMVVTGIGLAIRVQN